MRLHTKLKPAIFALVTATTAAAAEPVFIADFDSPVRIGGTALPVSFAHDRIVEGRHGRGCHFAPLSANLLPSRLASIETNVVNGVFEATGFRFASETRWRSYFRDAHVVSAWVKGAPGTELEIAVHFAKTGRSDGQLEREWARTVKQRDKSAKNARVVADAEFPSKVTLTGGWQRVAAYSIMDARRCVNRYLSVRFATAGGESFEMRRMQYEIQQRPESARKNAAPGIWSPAGGSSRPTICAFDLAKFGVKFPFRAGSFVAWMKYPELSNLRPTFDSFLCWDRLDFTEQKSDVGRGTRRLPPALDGGDTGWQHVAITWSPTNAVLYRNGTVVASAPRDVKGVNEEPVSTLRVGGGGWAGRVMCDFIMDDIALFAETLAPAEISRIAAAEGSLRPSNGEWYAEKTGCCLFPRNECAARASFTIYSPAAAPAKFTLKVGDLIETTLKTDLAPGANLVTVPFDARVFPVGTQPFTLVGVERRRLFAKDVERIRITGEFEITSRFDRGAYHTVNWGGSTHIPLDYAVSAGMNTMLLGSGTPGETLDRMQRGGVHCAVNIFNHADACDTGFDEKEIKARLAARLRRHAGRANWSMSLTTTEAAGLRGINRWVNLPKWMAYAEKELGHKPRGGICGPAFSLVRPVGWKSPACGILDTDRDEDLATLLWADRRGDPVLQLNRMDAELVHKLSPGNLVWAEPSCPYGVEMTAYWAYEYPLDRVVSRLKRSYAAARGIGTAFMPTLGMGTCPALRGSVPGCDGKVLLAQTCDELVIKTLAVAGVTRANAMSYFDLSSWVEGEKHADKPLAGALYAEAGSGEKFGRRMRRDLLPALMLLQDMDTFDSDRVAVVLSEVTDHTHGIGWTYRGYIFDVTATLFDVIPECTILHDAEIAKAGGYRHLFLPGASSVSRRNYEAVAAAAAGGTKVYTDFLCRQRYPGAVRFDDGSAKTNYYNNYSALAAQLGPSMKRLRSLIEDIRRESHDASAAFVEECDGTVRVYPRLSEGECRYFLCLNDTRRRGPFSDYLPGSPDYMPYGKPCKATVSLKIPDGCAVYDFFTSKRLACEYRGGRAFVRLDLPAADAALLCAYPDAPERLTAVYSKTSDAREGAIEVELLDADGKPVKGRQLVELRLTDSSGKPRDESGLYKLVNGHCAIPVYLPVGGGDERFSAEIVERTTGLKAALRAAD